MFNAMCADSDLELNCAAYMYCDAGDDDCAMMAICMMDFRCYAALTITAACLELGSNEVCMMSLCTIDDVAC